MGLFKKSCKIGADLQCFIQDCCKDVKDFLCLWANVQLLMLCFDTVTRLRNAIILVQTLKLSGSLVNSDQVGHHFLMRKAFGNLLCSQKILSAMTLFHKISMLIQPFWG